MDPSQLPYRQGVGLCLFNREGLVLCAERRDKPGAWQMPQGGVQKGEAPHVAALRELKEEIGTDNAEIIAELPEKLTYEFPDWLQHGKSGDASAPYRGKYRGQEQTWFALKFLGTDTDISLEGEHEPEAPEFTAWKWVPITELANLIVEFKRPVYDKVIAAFAPIGIAIKKGDKLPGWRANDMVAIPALPNLEISGLTKKCGLDQETIDRLLCIIYEDRPDYYVRMAQHEGSGNKKAGDLFVNEFEGYMREKLGNDVDLAKTAIMTGVFWEVRRRARLMHGMSI